MRFQINFRLLFAVFLLIGVNQLTHAEVLVGRVVGVSDGDTITVLDKDKAEHKVRLMGIDAPESKQDFGAASKQALSNYIYQKEVTVDYKKIDKYSRLVGKVILNKQDICLAMISDGMVCTTKTTKKSSQKQTKICTVKQNSKQDKQR